MATNYSCGSASIDPVAEVTAGSYGTWRLTYVAGPDGVAPGGAIRVDTECDTDWGIPQLADPQGAEYMTLQTPTDVRIGLLVEDAKSVLLVLKGRKLRPEERLVLVYGDRSGGGPGSRAQTFLEGKRYFRVAVDTAGDGRFRALPDSPHLTVVGGPAVKLVTIAPSNVTVGERFRLLVRAEDEWGNPSKGMRGRWIFTPKAYLCQGPDRPSTPVATVSFT